MVRKVIFNFDLLKGIKKKRNPKVKYLKEGEEIMIVAKEGTSRAFVVMVCYDKCIMKKSEMEILN